MELQADPRPYIAVLLKHLPPSAAELHLLDVGGTAGKMLASLREDINLSIVEGAARDWQRPPDSIDAVTAFDCAPESGFLHAALTVLRPGGRLIMIQPDEDVHQALVMILENAGYARILVEPALPDEAGGVLMRGEKPHVTHDTVERVRSVARQDEGTPRGSYVYLLVFQTPNKPVWALQPDETITWEALALRGREKPVALAFMSLPRAVNFMQEAVLAGIVTGVNKMPKFRYEVMQSWPFDVLLNPTIEVFEGQTIQRLPLDPETAETPDE